MIQRHLRQARDHVASGEKLVEKQRAIVAKLAADGHRTDTARRLLGQLEEVQAMHIADRDRLIDELARCAR